MNEYRQTPNRPTGQREQNDLQSAVDEFERYSRYNPAAAGRRTAPAAEDRRPPARGGSGKKRRARPLPPWLLVFFCFIYDTILFHIWSNSLKFGPGGFGRWIGILLFAVAFACLFSLIATISRNRKAHLVLGLIVTIFWSVMFLLEYFILDPFKNFMKISEILSGAGNAAQPDFAKRTFGLVLRGFWRIILFALPIVGWFLANKYLKLRRLLTRGVRRYLFYVGMIFTVVAVFFALVISKDSRKLTDSYQFTEAVNSFGLPVALVREEIGGEPADYGDPDFSNSKVDYNAPAGTSEQNPSGTPKPTDGPAPSGSDVPDPTDPLDPTASEPVSEQPTEPITPAKAYSSLAIDFPSLIQNARSADVKKVHEHVYSLMPSKTNEMTGIFQGKNLILITAEGFAKELIREDLTPTLYRMYTKGITFTDYYQPAWGGSTSTGEYSILTGLEPYDGVNSIMETVGHNMYMTIGNQLRRLGYFSRAYHNNSYTYYGRDKTHENLGYEKYIGMGNGMEEGVKKRWPESDQEMINFTVKQYIDKQPFSIYYMTVSGHGLYSWQGNSMSYLHKDEVQDLPYDDTIKAFFACNIEVELAMRDLIAQLEEAGIADDTVIVLTADHYPYCLEKSDTWNNPKDCLSELYGYQVNDCFGQDHNALLIWSGCLEDKNIQVDTPVYSLDILPTLSNLFGVEWDSRLLPGRDVFSDAVPLVLWPNRSWKTDMGSYNARTGKFTPAPGVTVPEGYTDEIDQLVRQKIRFSDDVLDLDYYNILFG